MACDETSAKKQGGKSKLSQYLKVVRRLGLTLVITAGSILAVGFGASELAQRAKAVPSTAPANIIPVAVRPVIHEEAYTVRRSFIGQVEPRKITMLSFELPGRLSEILVEEGDRVRQGQMLARQDVSLLFSERDQLQASRSALQAQLRFADQTVKRENRLTDRGFTSQAGLDEALARQRELNARIKEIDARLQNVAIRISKSELLAPFDGQITDRMVDGAESLSPGQPVFGLLELRKPQVRIGVALDVNEANLEFATIDIDGIEYAATLLTLRPDVDPLTRTRTAVFELDALDDPVFGQTARLIYQETVAARGVWLPTTSLKEGARGQWTVLMVDQVNTVRSASIEILHAEGDRVFVRGAFPKGTRLIEAGPHRVTVGQTVAPLDAS